MKKKSLAVTIAAALCSTTVATAAQSAGAAPQNTAAPEKMRLTGCIERADQLVGNGSTVGTSVDSMDLVLIKAMPASESRSANANASAQPTGTSGASGDMGKGKMYRLTMADTVKANPHVGHQVEISGSIQTAGAGVSPAAPAAPTVDELNPSAANAPMFKVESLRMISETCPK